MKAPRWRLAAASALLAASTLAPGLALADENAPAPIAAPAPEAPAPAASQATAPGDAAQPAAPSTPLHLRSSGGLNLSSPGTTTSRPWLSNLLLIALVGGAGFFLYKRKEAANKRGPSAPATMRVLGRLPLGGRGEAVMVEIEGRRMLLGVTAQSVQHIADIEDEPEAPAAASALREAGREAGREPFADMLRAARAAKAVEMRERGDEAAKPEVDERRRPSASRRAAAAATPAAEPAEPVEPRLIERQVLGLRRKGQEP